MPATIHTGEVPARMVGRLREQAGDIRRLTAGFSEELLARRTAANTWSLKELIAHLWRVQEVFETRVEAMLTESNPAIARYEPDGDTEMQEKLKGTGEELLEAFLAEREQFLTLLDSLSGADWHRPGRHPEFTRYDVQFQVEYMVHHEAHHIYQMFQRRAQLVAG